MLIRGYLLPWAATPLRRAPPPLAFVAPGVPLKCWEDVVAPLFAIQALLSFPEFTERDFRYASAPSTSFTRGSFPSRADSQIFSGNHEVT